MSTPDYTDHCWPVDPACGADEWDSYGEDVQARATALATSTLRLLTAQRVGGCPITVRPCAQRRTGGFPLGWDYGYPYGYAPFIPMQLASGAVVNCCGASTCGCESGCEIKLDTYVGTISSIQVGAVELYVGHESDFRIDNDSIIVYQGTDTCPFPVRPDMSAAPGADGYFAITYLPSRPVDGQAAYAAGVLAVEYAKACSGSKACRLPSGVTQVVKQGITYQVTPGTFPNGVTGIREVDTYIVSINPNGLKVAPAIWSPDLPQSRVSR